MTETEIREAVAKLLDWKQTDPLVASMVSIVCAFWHVLDVGHLARQYPGAFDELFEEAEAAVENDE